MRYKKRHIRLHYTKHAVTKQHYWWYSTGVITKIGYVSPFFSDVSKLMIALQQRFGNKPKGRYERPR